MNDERALIKLVNARTRIICNCRHHQEVKWQQTLVQLTRTQRRSRGSKPRTRRVTRTRRILRQVPPISAPALSSSSIRAML